MNLFNRKSQGLEEHEQKYVVIVGCGRLGANLADAICEDGGDVMIIDRDKEAFRKLDSSYGGLTMVADAVDMDVLMQAQAEKADCVISVTDDDNVNIMVSQLARELFNTDKVVCRLYDPEKECVYSQMGISTICPTVLSANEIGKLLAAPRRVPA